MPEINFAPMGIPTTPANAEVIPDAVKRRLLAWQMLQQQAASANTPVYTGAQGAAKLGAGAFGGIMEGITDAQEQAAQKQSWANYADSRIPGGAPSSSPAPATPTPGLDVSPSGAAGVPSPSPVAAALMGGQDQGDSGVLPDAPPAGPSPVAAAMAAPVSSPDTIPQGPSNNAVIASALMPPTARPTQVPPPPVASAQPSATPDMISPDDMAQQAIAENARMKGAGPSPVAAALAATPAPNGAVIDRLTGKPIPVNPDGTAANVADPTMAQPSAGQKIAMAMMPPSAPQMPAGAPPVAAPPMRAPPPPASQGNISPDELAIRTIAAETSGNPAETAGIANVIKNRLASGKWGDNVASVVLAPNQFEPWNKGSGNDPMSIDPNSPRFQQAAAIWQGIKSGQVGDPTNGATHFFAPDAQAKLGRNIPSWAQGQQGQQIGATAFYAPEGRVTASAAPGAQAINAAAPQGGPQGQGQPQPQTVAQNGPQGQQPGLPPAPAQPPFDRAKIMAVIQDPRIPPAAKQNLLDQLTPEYGFQTTPNGDVLRTDKRTGQVTSVYQTPIKPELKDMGTDPITGQHTYQEYNPQNHTLQPVGAGAGAPAAPQSGMLAKGVTAIDHSLSGDDYLNQFGPEVQSAVKAYMNGDVMPTGNPRAQTIASTAKIIAQKYGQDMGIPVNDEIYAGKRKMITDLGATGNSSLGGVLSNGKSAFAHLANASDKLVDVGNYNGPNIPGGGIIASAGNLIGNFAGTSATQGKIAAAKDNLMHYGQEATKFYAGSGGGEGERLAALRNNNPATASGNEQAAFLQTEKELMLERLGEKESQISSVLGPQYLVDHPVRTPDFQNSIAKIDANIAKLRGVAPQAGGAQAAQPAAPAQPQFDRSAMEAEARRRGLIK